MSKKIKSIKPIFESTTESYLDEIMKDWRELEKRENAYDTKYNNTLKNNNFKPINLSKVENLEVTLPDGSKDVINPRSIAFFVRGIIKDLRKNSDFDAIISFLDKDIIWTLDIETACTDGIRIAMNPIFADMLLSKGVQMGKDAMSNNPNIKPDAYVGRCIAFTLMHEIYHILYRHVRRAMLKKETASDPYQDLCNIAMDVEINRDIEYQFPEYFLNIHNYMGVLWDENFMHGEMWEQIYDAYYTGQSTPPQMKSNDVNPGNSKNPQPKQQNNKQQNNNKNNDNQPNKDDLNKKSESYLRGFKDALEKLKKGELSVSLKMNESADNIVIPQNVADPNDYEQGFRDAIEAYKKLKQAAKEAQQQQAQGGQNNNGDNSNNNGQNQNSNGNNGGSSNGGQNNSSNGNDSESNNGASSDSSSDDSDDINSIDGSTLEVSPNATCGESFNFGDLLSKEEMAALAAAAGQPYDSEDLSADPVKKAEEFIKNNAEKLAGVGKKAGSGNGNTMAEVLKKCNELFRPKVNWQRQLEKFFNRVAEKDYKYVYSRKRLGSRSPDMEAGRYTKPNLKISYKDGGIAQVFHLMDNSGSMYGQTRGDGENIFRQIFGEILGMEKKAHIQRSAAAYFCSGLKDKEIASWTEKSTKHEIFKKLEYTRSLNKMGGTEIAPALRSIYKIGTPYFSNTDPVTLMLIYTDGELGSSDYNYFGELRRTIKSHIIFLIINESDSSMARTEEKLKEAGITQSCIIKINANEIK